MIHSVIDKLYFYKALSQHLSGGTEENHEKPQSGQPVSGPRFEPVYEALLLDLYVR
jgi:hypothetical protein